MAQQVSAENAGRISAPLQWGTLCLVVSCNYNSIDISCGAWARIVGSVRSINDGRTLNIYSIKPIIDMNEVTLHFLQAIALVTPSQVQPIQPCYFIPK